MSLYNGPPRPGARGGRDQFSWENVKADKDREYYLGHSVKALAGRWQKGRDVYWYTREKQGQDALQDELKAVKQREEELMMEALGLKPKTAIRPATQLDKHELNELIKGKPQDDPEQDQEEGGVGPAQDAACAKGLGFVSGAGGGAPSEAVHVTLPGVGSAGAPGPSGPRAGGQKRLSPSPPGPFSRFRPVAALALPSGVTAVQPKETRRAEKRAKKEAKKAKKAARKPAKKAKRDVDEDKGRGDRKSFKHVSRSSSASSSSSENDDREGASHHRQHKYDNHGNDDQRERRPGFGSAPVLPPAPLSYHGKPRRDCDNDECIDWDRRQGRRGKAELPQRGGIRSRSPVPRRRRHDSRSRSRSPRGRHGAGDSGSRRDTANDRGLGWAASRAAETRHVRYDGMSHGCDRSPRGRTREDAELLRDASRKEHVEVRYITGGRAEKRSGMGGWDTARGCEELDAREQLWGPRHHDHRSPGRGKAYEL